MTSAFGKGTAHQRRLGGLLRQLRKAARLSGPTLARRLGVSQSHLSRVELAEAIATEDLVHNWCRETAASPADRQAATELAEAVAAELFTWQEAVASGLVKLQRDILDAEAASATVSAYVPSLIPGLMQTPEYATELVSSDYPDRDDIANAVAMRMQRQVILYSRDKNLRWVVGEAGLRWRMGLPEVMAAQLDRLAALAAEPHLDLRVLPFERTAPVWHDHGFTLFSDRADGEPELVNLELLTGMINITDAKKVVQYRAAYERLAELAVGGEEAVAMIRRVRTELLSEQ